MGTGSGPNPSTDDPSARLASSRGLDLCHCLRCLQSARCTGLHPARRCECAWSAVEYDIRLDECRASQLYDNQQEDECVAERTQRLGPAAATAASVPRRPPRHRRRRSCRSCQECCGGHGPQFSIFVNEYILSYTEEGHSRNEAVVKILKMTVVLVVP